MAFQRLGIPGFTPTISNQPMLKSGYLMEMDDRYGVNNPLDSVHKLNIIVRKCGSGKEAVSKMEWVLSLMCDLFMHDALTVRDFAKATMEGTGASPTKGSVDVALAKADMLTYLSRFCHDEIRNADVMERMGDP